MMVVRLQRCNFMTALLHLLNVFRKKIWSICVLVE